MTYAPTRRPLLFLSPHPRLCALAFLAVLCLQSTACAPDEREREPELGLTASQLRECENGSTQTLACGLNGRGTQSRTCKANRWSEPTACVDSDVCVDGTSEALSCGLNGRGTQARTCAAGSWGEPSSCTDPDVCLDGDEQRAPGHHAVRGRGRLHRRLCRVEHLQR